MEGKVTEVTTLNDENMAILKWRRSLTNFKVIVSLIFIIRFCQIRVYCIQNIREMVSI